MGWSRADLDQALTRVRRVIDRHVAPAVHPIAIPLEVSAHHVRGEPVPPEVAFAARYLPFEVGDPWGPPWGTTWFRMRGHVPAAWDGHEVVARVAVNRFQRTGFGAEGLVWIDGEPRQGISPNHDLITVGSPARAGQEVDFHVEAAANPMWHIADGVPGIGGLPEPDPDAAPACRLERAELAIHVPEVRELHVVMEHLLDLAQVLSPDEARTHELVAALTDVCRLIDPDDVHGSVSAAQEALRAVLGRPAAASAHRITALGHAHIDTAWLWPLRETVRKSSRTFSTVVTLMDAYPEFRFVCSQPQQYAWIKERYPSLYARIREKIAGGQWEPVGSMWVEADCNIPSGESLVRQLVHGKRFFLDEFGLETRELFLPDAFGYSPVLPQLMKLAGIDYFLSTKLAWNQENRFPHDSFWWEGLDGTRVLAHFPPADTYNGMATPEELVGSARSFAEQGADDGSVYLYGWGDGGGGPTSEMIDRLRLSADLEGLPRVEHGSLLGFFDALSERAAGLAVWAGELYLELHRGTFTTQARVKRDNRRAETLLRQTELWSSLLAEPSRYPAKELDASWKLLLLHQFHDIIPGSSIGWVYEDTKRDHLRVTQTLEQLGGTLLEAVTASIDTSAFEAPHVVFNALPHARRALIDTPGGPVPVAVPPVGFRTVEAVEPADEVGTVQVGPDWLSNEHLLVRWDDRGLLTSIWDRDAEREVLAEGAVGNVLQLHRDEPNDHDAWDIDRFALDEVSSVEQLDQVEVVEDHPHRGRVRIVRSFGRSRIEQTLELTSGSRRLDVHNVVDWQERHVLLKVAFPVAVHAAAATFEVQFGHVQRPTHVNTSWDRSRFEVMAQRWADLSETGYGVALLNDSKYGYDVRGNVLRLSLLRSPTSPDPEADRGVHTFTYALYPHRGGPQLAGVVEAAAELNEPVTVLATDPHPGELPPAASLLSVDRPGVAVSAVKRTDDGDGRLVVRLVEDRGQRGEATLSLAGGVLRADRVDLLERPLEALEVHDGAVTVPLRPFEVVTLRLQLQTDAADRAPVQAHQDGRPVNEPLGGNT